VLAEVFAYDPLVGASLRLMSAWAAAQGVGAVPAFEHVMPFTETGLPEPATAGGSVCCGSRARAAGCAGCPWPRRFSTAALELASRRGRQPRRPHGRSGRRDLKRNLRRFDYVLEKFGITLRKRGATGHGLRHERLNDAYEGIAGVPSPVRGGGPVSSELDRAARLAVSQLAGHARLRASGAYLGSSAVMRSKGRKPSEPPMT
jgi:hypothetical protein